MYERLLNVTRDVSSRLKDSDRLRCDCQQAMELEHVVWRPDVTSICTTMMRYLNAPA